jgi:CheY-like chemotaxis protein
LIGEHISFSTLLTEGKGRIRADPGQIEQVIMNLVVNARDAMPQGGRLTVETRDVVADEAFVHGRGQMAPGRYVMLAVSDTGHGIDAATQARMFEPFFTTKAQGKGTGLGLSTVYGIVVQSQGHIEVESRPGSGTTFRIYLPSVDEEPEGPAFALKASGSLQGSETILLVEDEELVRGVTRAMLSTNGYRVLVAGSGEEAIGVCRSHAGAIDLVMTDLVMPGMNGRQTVEHLERLRPGVRVLFTSGYASDEIVRHGVLVEGTEFIQKPFTAETLARKVREILDL